MMRRRLLLLTLPICILAGCARGDDEDEGPAVEPAAPSAVTAAAPDPAEPGDAPRPPTQEEVDSADAADARDFQHRMATRETYTGCMRKAAGGEGEARARIEAACKRLPGAPR